MKTTASAQSAGRRRYESPLREEQQAATRQRLVDAMMAQLRAGASDLSIARIAQDARVAVPTVYRHFPARRDLLEAIVAEVHRLVPPPPPDPDIRAMAKAFFRWRDEVARRLGSVAGTPLLWEMRRELTVPSRRAFVESIVAEHVGEIRDPERTWLVDVLVVLFSDTMASAFRGYLGLDPDASADRAVYCFEALVAHARGARRSRKGSKEKPR